MKVGISMWSYVHPFKAGELSIEGFIKEAANSGADGVELLDFFYKDPPSERSRARDTLSETGLSCPIFSVGNNFAQAGQEQRKQALDAIVFGLDEALFYGSSVVRVFAGDLSDGIEFEDARAWIIEGLTQASHEAHDRGLRIALENHGKLAGRGEQVREIIDEVRFRAGNDALGANPDTGNFLLVEQASHEAIQLVAPLAYMVHFKDFRQVAPDYEGVCYDSISGKRFVGTSIGEGEVDLPQCIQILSDSGYEGWLSTEYEGDESPFTAVPRSIAYAKSVVNSVAESTS